MSEINKTLLFICACLVGVFLLCLGFGFGHLSGESAENQRIYYRVRDIQDEAVRQGYAEYTTNLNSSWSSPGGFRWKGKQP